MWQRIDVIYCVDGMMAGIVSVHDDRNGSIVFSADGDKEKDDGGLENVQTDNLLDEVVFGDHGPQTDHHQRNVDPEVDLGYQNRYQVVHP